MKYPFWLINSILLSILLIVLGFIFFSRPIIPEVAALNVDENVELPKKEISAINLELIYENDLFDTYKPITPPAPIEKPQVKKPIPPPPQPQPITIPIAPLPQFRDPLSIRLVGLIVIDDDSQNIAMIQDKTGANINLRIGDAFEDAQLIRIMKNKIMFLRSNGQQEILYINHTDAQEDQKLLRQDRWNLVAKKIDDYHYIIDTHAFLAYIPNIGAFIDALNLTTVFSKGESIGCRIGAMSPPMLGTALGLQQGDIIVAVNDISAKETASRFEIYKNITALPQPGRVTVEILRKQQPMTLQYTLQNNIDKKDQSEPLQSLGVSSSNLQEITKNTDDLVERILQEKESYASTKQDLQLRDKRNMFAHNPRAGNRRKNVLFNSAKQEL